MVENIMILEQKNRELMNKYAIYKKKINEYHF
jgi:hypothetical protein